MSSFMCQATLSIKFDILFLDLIKEDYRLDVLKKALDIYIASENYEEAAYIRDIINFY